MSSGGGAGERRFRALLRLYPAEVRDQYGLELRAAFRFHRDRRLSSHGRLGVGFWWFVTRDTLSAAWRERADPISDHPGVDIERKGDGMRGWLDDFGYAARRLWRSPGFSLTALVILVLGIGVNTSAFSIVNALLLQPPPFPEAEALVDLLQDSDDGRPNSTSYPAYLDIARTEGVFESVAAVSNAEAFMEDEGHVTSVFIEYATSGYMDVLGLSPVRGRWFTDAEDDPSGPAVAVLTHKYWTDRLGQDPDVIGSTVRLNGATLTVVGVGPPDFNGGAGPAISDMWLSIGSMAPTGGAVWSLSRREDHPFFVRARLLPEVTVERATVAMDQLADELAATYPIVNEARRIHTIPVADIRIHPEVDSQLLPGAALLMVVVALVLVVGTLNLANLLLVRTTARAREIAVRLAMGAGRARITRVVLSEALVLAALGGVGGLAAAMWSLRLIEGRSAALSMPVILDVRIDATVFLFTAAISLLSGLAFGLVPALRVTRRDITASLRDEAVVSIGARRRFGLTGLLVAGQVSMSLVLLAVGGIFLESLVRAGSAEPGFEWESTGYARLSLQPLGLDREGTTVTLRQLDERLEALPEVSQASLAFQLPGAHFGTTTMLVGAGLGGVNQPTEIPWNLVDLDYFELMGIRVVEGRLFQPADFEGPPIAIVSEAMARAFWGRTDIVGESVFRESQPDEPLLIIGVVSDVPVRSLGEAPAPVVYWPYEAGSWGNPYLTVRTAGDADAAVAAVRDAIRAFDSRIMITASMSMEDHLGATLGQQRLAGSVLGGMGVLALFLAVLGIYGVVSFAVSRRRREVGIRQALGASGSAVVGLFLRDVGAVVGVGAVLGLIVAIPLTGFIAGEFTGGEGSPALVVGVALLLTVTALAATLIPASGAARNDPRDVLSAE